MVLSSSRMNFRFHCSAYFAASIMAFCVAGSCFAHEALDMMRATHWWV
jgi:hypothetical protein